MGRNLQMTMKWDQLGCDFPLGAIGHLRVSNIEIAFGLMVGVADPCYT